jgi:hypothetical protein
MMMPKSAIDLPVNRPQRPFVKEVAVDVPEREHHAIPYHNAYEEWHRLSMGVKTTEPQHDPLDQPRDENRKPEIPKHPLSPQKIPQRVKGPPDKIAA